MPATRVPILGLLPAELEQALTALGAPRYRAAQLFQWLHQKIGRASCRERVCQYV